MTIDQRLPADQLHARLAAAGFALTWPPARHDEWQAIARRIARNEPLPPRPTVYDPEVMRAIHAVDTVAAQAAMRSAAGWLHAPHGDRDFGDTLRIWETGECGDPGSSERHFVAAGCAASGRGQDRVDVARCKDCGFPVYTVGLDWRLRHGPEQDQVMGWRPIWP